MAKRDKKGTNNSKQKASLSGKLITAAIVVFLFFVFVLLGGGGSSDNSSSSHSTNSQSQGTASNKADVAVQQEVVESTEDGEEDASQDTYIGNAAVHRFVRDYNNISSSPIDGISEGNIRTKYYGYTYDRQIEMLDGDDGALHITVRANYNHPEMAEMRDVFHDVVATLDPTLSDDVIYDAYDRALEENLIVENVQLGTVTYTWTPTVELSSGPSFGRFEVSSSSW